MVVLLCYCVILCYDQQIIYIVFSPCLYSQTVEQTIWVWKHLRAKLMLWPFHLRCETMDFLDIQEMLMVIFMYHLNWIIFRISSGSISNWAELQYIVQVIVSDVDVYGVIVPPGTQDGQNISFTSSDPPASSPDNPQYKFVPTLSSDRVLDNNNVWQGLRKVRLRLPINIKLDTPPGFDIFR